MCGLLFAAPLFVLLLVYSYGDAWNSFLMGESSPQIGGLPFYFILKAGIPVSAFLVVIHTFNLVFNPQVAKVDLA